MTKHGFCDILIMLREGVGKMSVLDGFTAFNFNEGVPYISLTRNGLTFNKAVIMKLGYPSHVVLLMNEEKKQIAIQPCDEKTDNSTVFYKEGKRSNVLSVRWNGKDLLNTLQSMTGWDLETKSYRINGILLKDELAMLFDLNDATILK